ncbi:GNAT family N-acetyltransferase [Candidatus Saccharibacteria bacterium]|nr:MAG: GNAT family N-acetyltransferase [Candidatus Saccharibacteria bacterium]
MSANPYETYTIPPFGVLSHRDREAMYKVIKQAFNFDDGGGAADYFRVLATNLFVVATNTAKEPVGVGVIDTHDWPTTGTIHIARASLLRIGVLPAEQGKNVGTIVMNTCEETVRSLGAQFFSVAPDPGREIFYEKLGYAPHPDFPEEYVKQL